VFSVSSVVKAFASASHDRRQLQAVSGNLQRKHAAAGISHGGRNPTGGALLDQKNHAAAATRAANFGRSAAVLAGNRDQFISLTRFHPTTSTLYFLSLTARHRDGNTTP